jgi:hypothetical protein
MPKNLPDFRATVAFLSEEQGGRKAQPRQGYRPDIRYADDVNSQAWMAWPLFLSNDRFELEYGATVPGFCDANFYIVDPQLRREVHASRLKAGIQFDLVEGARGIAVCKVTAVLSLHENLT